MTPYDPRKTRTYANINLHALAANVQAVQALLAPDSVMAVVKADAYGHGAVPVARVCASNGIAHFGVATVDEALELRRAGIRADVYLLGAFVPEEAEAIVRGDITPFVSSPEHYAALAHAAQTAPLPARAFMVVDTGMGREGMLPETARTVWNAPQTNVRLTGIASHLAVADDLEPDATDATRAQIEAFAAFIQSVAGTFAGRDDGRGNAGVTLSALNSPGSLRRAEWRGLPEGVLGIRAVLHRAGLSLFGIEPHKGAFTAMPALTPVLSWCARVVLVRDLPEGATVGYGRTWTATRPSRIATLACGYADGYPRRLSSRGIVTLGGERFPVVGRVSMDQLQIDVTDARVLVRLGDTGVLLGVGGANIREFAESTGTTAHEPTCALSRRVPRLYTGGTGQ